MPKETGLKQKNLSWFIKKRSTTKATSTKQNPKFKKSTNVACERSKSTEKENSHTGKSNENLANTDASSSSKTVFKNPIKIKNSILSFAQTPYSLESMKSEKLCEKTNSVEQDCCDYDLTMKFVLDSQGNKVFDCFQERELSTNYEDTPVDSEMYLEFEKGIVVQSTLKVEEDWI